MIGVALVGWAVSLLPADEASAAGPGNGARTDGGDGGAAVSGSGGGQQPAASGIKPRSQSEVEKTIATDGPKPPDWLAATALRFPATLDLTWARPARGQRWDQNKYLGQFIWSVVNPNPSQWKNGVKLMYKVMDVNKDDETKLVQTYDALARMYFNYFKDYARAAYWWQKAGESSNIQLARCYFELGNLDMAKKILLQYPFDTTREGDVINAWGTFGDMDRALRIAKDRISSNAPDIGDGVAGDVCRVAGRYDDALKYYSEYMKLPKMYNWKNKQRAQDGYNTIKYFQMFNLAKVPDGTYSGSATGYRGAVTSKVTVKDHKIVDIKVSHREDQCYSAITQVPGEILQKQSVKDIDACAGATMTSNAIIMGTAKAMGDAAKP